MDRIVYRNKGVTLVELLVVLVISGILMAALYRTFIKQQKTYTIQDQVVDMQQNVRVAFDRMTRELRMAGYGGGTNILSVFDGPNYVNTFSQIIKLENNVNNVGTNDDRITIIFADQVGVLSSNTPKNSTSVSVTNASSLFNNTTKKYLNLNGLNNYLISSVSGSSITIDATKHPTGLIEDHVATEPVYLVKAITYDLGTVDGKPTLRRNENTGGGAQALAENIENLQLTSSTDANGNTIIQVAITARTSISDPDYGSGGGYRKRVLTSSIKVRNMGL